MTEQDSKVSVIMPCYNYGHFVIEALDSVKSQTFTNWECVIVNDGSTDNSREVIEEYIKGDPRFRLINISNGGVSNARNTAIAQSSGKYLFPLDADNKIHPDCLSRCVAEFEKKPGTKLVYTEARFFGAQSGLWGLPDFDYQTMLKYNMVDNTSLFLREDFDRTGGYRTNMTHGLEDWDFFITLLYGCTNEQVIKIKEPLFYYRTSSSARGSMVVKRNQFEQMTDNIVYNNFHVYQEYYPDILRRLLEYDFNKRMMSKRLVRWVANFLMTLTTMKERIASQRNRNHLN